MTSAPPRSPATPAERLRLAAALLAAVALLAGCLGGSATQDERTGAAAEDRASGRASAAGPPVVSERQQVRRAQRVLDQRARAVRRGDLQLFLRHVDRSDAAFVARQERYFRNVVQLPWQTFSYEVLGSTWDVATRPRWGRVLRVPEVVQRTRLRGFDSLDVERTVGFVLAYDAQGTRLVSDRGRAGTILFLGAPAPWDLTEVEVRRTEDVLGVFDTGSLGSAAEVMATAQAGVSQVDEALPVTWGRRAVVYVVREREVLESFTGVPGGSIGRLGAMTFPTYSRPEVSAVASTRMLLLDTSVAAGQPFLARILRHELTHIALGSSDDGAPAWLTEGLAEYVGARPLPRAERVIPSAAVRRSAGAVDEMPRSEEFNGSDQEWHYALSWMAVDHVATTSGEATVWQLVEQLAAPGRTGRDEGQDAVLRRLLGHGSAELARRAAQRIRNLYA